MDLSLLPFRVVPVKPRSARQPGNPLVWWRGKQFNCCPQPKGMVPWCRVSGQGTRVSANTNHRMRRYWLNSRICKQRRKAAAVGACRMSQPNPGGDFSLVWNLSRNYRVQEVHMGGCPHQSQNQRQHWDVHGIRVTDFRFSLEPVSLYCQ